MNTNELTLDLDCIDFDDPVTANNKLREQKHKILDAESFESNEEYLKRRSELESEIDEIKRSHIYESSEHTDLTPHRDYDVIECEDCLTVSPTDQWGSNTVVGSGEIAPTITLKQCPECGHTQWFNTTTDNLTPSPIAQLRPGAIRSSRLRRSECAGLPTQFLVVAYLFVSTYQTFIVHKTHTLYMESTTTSPTPTSQQNENGPCPACGDVDCNRTINIVGDGHPVHRSDHPEIRAERAREERNARHLTHR